MIDHVSIGVRDLETATLFYHAVLSLLGYQQLATEPATVGFGKKYPEFWLNLRRNALVPAHDNGCHICLRAGSAQIVDDFYALALQLGATGNGAPGLRPHYNERYYACFIRDADANHIEVVTYV
jgi:catechol 2,3-dioxygenase-like lactoylglutathione lyase family enzyme